VRPALRQVRRTASARPFESIAEKNRHDEALEIAAADRSFGDLRKHVKAIDYDGVPILTLDIDGMLITKDTVRESDRADRLKLRRLKLALAEAGKPEKSDTPAWRSNSKPARKKTRR
jgi:hypothetical protein